MHQSRMPIRILLATLTSKSHHHHHHHHANPTRLFSSTTPRPATDFTHAIIGAGVVGLAIAERLQTAHPHAATLLLEQHGAVGTETSSRNSEVIHAGIYYPPASLKTRLCIRGRELLYALADGEGVAHRRTGKWIVAQDERQHCVLREMHEKARGLGVPVRWVGEREAQEREPAVRARAGVLESTSTGIVDAHGLMVYLLGAFEEAGGVTALGSKVVRIVPRGGTGGSGAAAGSNGWEVWTKSDGEEEEACIEVQTVINAAGLYAVDMMNMVVPAERRLKARYAKGTYYSYSSSSPKTNTLIYPAPVPGHGGTGTHLTLDLGGQIRFGPDVQWIDSPTDYVASDANLKAAIQEIKEYLPSLDETALVADYCGIRPKLPGGGGVGTGKGFQDFIIREEEGLKGWISLLGIESPGLTSSLAIAELVEKMLYK